jgi:uncharacterized protein YqfB (UPF0267 family)
MPLIHFQKRFADAVAIGTKRQTIRKTRRRPIKPGDALILGTWEGSPYRSKVRRLLKTECVSVDRVTISICGRVTVNGRDLGWRGRALLAIADGFSCCREMIEWFEDVHSLPFEGVIIRW